MTDKEIIKDLECCANCEDCFYGITNCSLGEEVECRSLLAQNTLDLINRQQVELDNLKVKNQSLRSAANSLKMHYEEAQAEIERLQKEVNLVSIQFQDIQERQEESQAEIERLNKVYQANQQLINALNKSYFLAKSEAVKEFVEKLKKNMHNKFKDLDEYEFEYITERDIDNLVKEIVGENNG